MICLKCDRENGFKIETRLVEQLYRSKTLLVLTKVTTCPDCGWFTVEGEQIDTLLKNTKELYHNIYGD